MLVRSRTRRLAELIGFDAQDQTRITTAISEIARNAYEYGGGGHIGFHLTGETTPPSFVIVVRDRGRGIADLAAVLVGIVQVRDRDGHWSAWRSAPDGYVWHYVEGR